MKIIKGIKCYNDEVEGQKIVCKCSHSQCRACDEDMINACSALKNNSGDGSYYWR
jgi:hypothetical protein